MSCIEPSPGVQFRSEAERRADQLELHGEARQQFVRTAMAALAVEAFKRDMEPMYRAVARIMLHHLPAVAHVIKADGSLERWEPVPLDPSVQELLRTTEQAVAARYGLTPAPADAAPPTSPPAARSGQ